MKKNTPHITFNQLKRAFLDSGYEVRRIPRFQLERLALDLPLHGKRHVDTGIMGLIMPDEGVIGISSDLDPYNAGVTLLHEIVHLYNEDLPEDVVEEITISLEDNLTEEQLGFLEFVSA